MNQFIVRTDIASIGIWDKKWRDHSISRSPVSKYSKRLLLGISRLPVSKCSKRLLLDAEKKQLFFIETGGDGSSGAHVYIEKDFNNDDYKLISNEFVIETTSGECVIDGLEYYGNQQRSKNLNIFSVAPGLYKVKLYVLKDAEDAEDSYNTLEGETPPEMFIEKFAIWSLIAFICSIYLLIKGKYVIGGILFTVFAVYSQFLEFLGKAQKKQRLLDKRIINVNVKKPYFVFILSRNTGNGHKGGWVSIANE